MGELSRRKTVVMITALVLMWGLCWPIYKVALHYTPAVLFAGMRTLLGGLFLIFLAAPTYKKIQLRRNWPVYVISTVLNAILFYGIQTVGLQYLPEGLFSVLVYLQPVLVGVLAWLWLGESMSVGKFIGLLLGFLGVAAISVTGLVGSLSGLGILLALVTAVSWALGTVYIKKAGGPVDGLWLVTIQCLLGGVVMMAAGLCTEHVSAIVWNLPYLTGLLYGAIFGIPLSWIIFFKLIQSGEASKVSAFTFLVPLIAVISGALLLHEPVTLNLLAGVVLIAVSIYLVNQRPRRRRLKSQSVEHVST